MTVEEVKKNSRLLGRGGFGVTHLARDRMLPGSPLCVIKQLFPKVSHPIALERAKQRFRREARILGRLGSHSQLPTHVPLPASVGL